MRRTVIALASALLLAAGLMQVPSAGGAPPTFDHLDPGALPQLHEELPVNVVFVGYEPADVKVAQLRTGLAAGYEPIVRSRADFGIEDPLGISYDYDYRFRFTGPEYEDRFFGRLADLSRPAPLTEYQQEYNDQDNNVLDVADNHFISAPAVERWLAFNAPTGINTRQNTIYFVNWYDRPDFEFHVYTKMNEPDPDTGYNFGRLRESRKIIAWGGTAHDDEENGPGSLRRVWFHDMSAGPETWAGSSNVDDADLDGDDVADYRIPAIWEYGPGAYRPLGQLPGDLARLTRYVALDLLMTTSPLYPPDLPTDELPMSVNLDSNTYEGWPGVDASSAYIKAPLLRAELGDLVRRNALTYDNQDLPYRGDARRCYLMLLEGESCYPQLGYPSRANLFLQNTFQFGRTRDDGDSVDYELPIFNYSVGEGVGSPALGFADNNYRNGTQSYVFNFVSPEIVESGYGLTTTMIHEVGHHLALSHPHDGYDSQSGVDFGPSGDFYFAWAGDESNSIMSYIDLNWDFSQFDRDNMNRFQAATLIEGANRLAAEALAADDPDAAADELARADVWVGRAEAAFGAHRYLRAMWYANRAYQLALEGAEEAGVDVESSLRRVRIANQAARQAASVHQPGEFIDTLEPGGPRSQP